MIERGVVGGRLAAALPEHCPCGTRLTSLLITARGSPATWYSARGDQPDLLDDALLNQIVEFCWERYEGGVRRYITGRPMMGLQRPQGSQT